MSNLQYTFQIINVDHASQLDSWLAENPSFVNITRVQLTDTQFLMPGLIDCHIHAPQMPNIGLGLDMELLTWLDTYTFPMETQYTDATFAAQVYEKVIVSSVLNIFLSI